MKETNIKRDKGRDNERDKRKTDKRKRDKVRYKEKIPRARGTRNTADFDSRNSSRQNTLNHS